MKPVYLGDSVYAQFDGYHIILTTNNGMGASNIICMEDSVLEAFDRYREQLAAKLAAPDMSEKV